MMDVPCQGKLKQQLPLIVCLNLFSLTEEEALTFMNGAE